MKVSLIEPLNISDELIMELSKPINEMGHEFAYYNDRATDAEELLNRSKDADIVMIANNPFPADVVKNLENLRLINVAFTGIDHVAINEAKNKGIKICNAAGYSNQAVAELAIGLTLNLFRQINAGDQDIRKEKFPGQIMGRELLGKTVGIIGTGNIGVKTAKLFQAFGGNIIAYSRTKRDAIAKMGVEYVDLDTLLSSSDVISVHLPLNENTRGFLDKEKLEKINSNAVLINCARGPIIDNAILAELLNKEKILGAAIDVFDMEPPIPSDYPLLNSKNTLLTPHVAYLTEESMIRRAHIAFNNTIAFLNDHPENIVE